MRKSYKLILWLIFTFVLMHFAKDITQDILKISSPLDVLGDIKEDISFLPQLFQYIFYYIFGGLSFVAEVFLIITIPIVTTGHKPKLTKYVVLSIVYLLIFLGACLLLDPKYRISL